MKAIIMPYMTYQNEPSVPFKTVYEINENDTITTVELLTRLFYSVFDNADGKKKDVTLSFDGGYGDIVVFVEGNDDCFLYVNYVDEPQTFVLYEGESSYLISGTREELDARLRDNDCAGYDSPKDFYDENDMYFRDKPIDDSRPFTIEEIIDRWI